MQARFIIVSVCALGLLAASADPAFAKRKKYDVPPWEQSTSEYKFEADNSKSGYIFNQNNKLLTDEARKKEEAAEARKAKAEAARLKKCKSGKCAPTRAKNSDFVFKAESTGRSAYVFDDDGTPVSSDEIAATASAGGKSSRKLKTVDPMWRAGASRGGRGDTPANATAGTGAAGAGAAGAGATGQAGPMPDVSGMIGGIVGSVTKSVGGTQGKDGGSGGAAGGMDMSKMLQGVTGGAGGGK